MALDSTNRAFAALRGLVDTAKTRAVEEAQRQEREKALAQKKAQERQQREENRREALRQQLEQARQEIARAPDEPSPGGTKSHEKARRAVIRSDSPNGRKEKPSRSRGEKSSEAHASAQSARLDAGLPVQHVGKGRPDGQKNPIPPFELTPGLPVSLEGDNLRRAIEQNRVIIVCGETGSGKTTQLPKICLMAGRGVHGLIGHTQPRRIAASSIAKRLAAELHTPLGEVVGYKVRFNDCTDPGASIKVMTDGILLAETRSDPLLKAYDTIIIDEAHERSINIDFLLGYLKRLLDKRKDLKVIVTSATIDAERFAQHFAIDDTPAPIFTISGRTYPVEIRYRPIDPNGQDDDRTIEAAIVDAVDELEMAGRGDILVFLPGEREIREAAEALRRHHRPGFVEVLPLYARLSVEEQERIFKPGGVRRIVLATNVAETSITVPGIRYVIDPGLARVKRYSYRNKVEQLLVEPVSQASANQRAGRCGRVANGICIRLFDENDFARRPAFTDPEIMRSNLAGVILRMKALRLGDIRLFPFVQRPPAKAISDGVAILEELGAVNAKGELTQAGRELSRLPIDPRFARMLLAAHEKGALREALIIVSGLAVQDVRERPLGAQDAADRAQKMFVSDKSDFLSYLKIWDWFIDQNAQKESNRKLAQALHDRFLSVRRMYEWRDVWHQLVELSEEIGWRSNTAAATYEQLHTALLTGLLGNLGMRQIDADFKAPPYLGARGIHFWPWPGSGLSKAASKWVMAAELVETSRLFARTVADIDPAWIERVASHLIRKSWIDPHWEKKRGEVVAHERGSLYGLTVYAGRSVSFGRHDPVLAREIFIREALVAFEMDSNAPFLSHNQRLVREVEEMEAKSRRPDVLVDEEEIFAFFDAIIPADVCDQASFEVWRKQVERDNPKLLFLSRKDLMRHGADGVTVEYYPKTLEMAGVAMALTYYFEPGSPRDGVTATVPLFVLNQINPVRCEWLVPGMLREKVQSLIKSLPQRMRRHCVPIAQYAMGFYERCGGVQVGMSTLVDALIADIREQTGVVCEKGDFKLEMLAPHMLMNFKVVDEHGRQLAMGRNLAQLRSELGEQAQKSFRDLAAKDAQTMVPADERIIGWSFGELPELMEITRKGQSLIGHPALCDDGEACYLTVFDDPLEAEREHRKGLRRLFILQMREQIRYLEKQLGSLQKVAMLGATVNAVRDRFDSVDRLRENVVALAVELSAMQKPWPANAQEFEARKNLARGKITLIGQEIARLLELIAMELSGAQKKFSMAKAWPEVVKDIEADWKRLFGVDFLLSVPYEQLRHYPRYVKAATVRLEKLRNDPGRDCVAMQDLARLSTPYWREVANRKGQLDERLEGFFWMLEELRVSLFAQELRTPMPVSVKRLTKAWEAIRRL